MNRVFVLLILILSSYNSYASIETSVVKVFSGKKDMPFSRHGSGLLFEHNGQYFVLSSDHVIFREGNPYIHKIWNEQIGDQNAEYLFADWGKGICLLKISTLTFPAGFNKNEIISFDNLKSIESYQNSLTHTYGYPALSRTLISDTQGVAQAPLFYWTLLSGLRYIAFLANSWAEFGMSGGPVFDDENNYLGVLSYLQLYDLQLPPEELEETPPQKGRVILVVPFDHIKEALRAYLETNNLEIWNLWESTVQSTKNEILVYSSHLEFKAVFDTSLKDITVTYKPKKYTPAIFQTYTGRSYYPQLELLLEAESKLNFNSESRAQLVGMNIEDSYGVVSHHGMFTSLHQFLAGYANTRQIFLFREPEPANLAKSLSTFSKLLKAQMSKITNKNSPLMTDLKKMTDSFANPQTHDWWGANPTGIAWFLQRHDSSLNSLANGTQIKSTLEDIRSYTAQFLL